MHTLVAETVPSDDIAMVVVRRTDPRRAAPNGDGVDLRRRFEPEAASARAARAFVSSALPEIEGLDERVSLAVSEVTSNAILHARTPFEVFVSVDARRVRVEVQDHDPRLPQRQDFGLDSVTGRGLAILETVSDRWGADSLRHDKTVWFEVDLPAAAETR
jgi:signal transduction histidine kinase